MVLLLYTNSRKKSILRHLDRQRPNEHLLEVDKPIACLQAATGFFQGTCIYCGKSLPGFYTGRCPKAPGWETRMQEVLDK